MASLPENPASTATLDAAWDDLRFTDHEQATTGWQSERIIAGALVVALHALFWGLLEAASRPEPVPLRETEAIHVDFIESLPPMVIAMPAPEKSPVAPGRLPEGVRTARPTSAKTVAADELDNVSPLLLYNDDGSIRLPENLLADIDKATGSQRSFDFQLPGLEASGTFLQHPPALEYQATRFDRYWRPNQDLLSELLTRFSEATTKEIKIPLPGDPSHSIVCTVSLLVAGMACGIARNGEDGDLRPGQDDPATLSAEEDRQCQLWWEKIVGASTQEQWRVTRKLYDSQCRKPLERIKPSLQ